MTVATYNCKVVSISGVRIRPENSTSNISLSTLPYNTEFQISEKLPDMDFPLDSSKVWGKLFGGIYDGKFVALEYNGHICDYTQISIIPPVDPPVTEKEIASTLDVTYNFASGKVTKFYRLEE